MKRNRDHVPELTALARVFHMLGIGIVIGAGLVTLGFPAWSADITGLVFLAVGIVKGLS